MGESSLIPETFASVYINSAIGFPVCADILSDSEVSRRSQFTPSGSSDEVK